MRHLKLSLVFLVLLIGPVFAALNFPALTGRVVDDAHILSSATIQSLDQILANYERTTTNQLVVVTVPSLQGVTIEQYGYQLGRTWGIGQKGKDNGVLLIVAPTERKVRIEVGYGLEGVLTDAICSTIVQGVILPNFRAGHMEAGIIEGVHAIIGDQSAEPVSKPISTDDIKSIIYLIFFGLIIIGKIILLFSPRFYLRHPFLSTMFLMSGTSSSSSGSGFSGGGGGFGGGGASGGW